MEWTAGEIKNSCLNLVYARTLEGHLTNHLVPHVVISTTGEIFSGYFGKIPHIRSE